MEEKTELQLAWDKLLVAIAKELRIDKLVDWMTCKINKFLK